MASYTDTIPQFNPYISQLPVEAMVQVGMEKQKRYDQGVQKIQTQIDNIAGLDVLRPQDKAYLQSKLNQLGSDLRGVAAGDFSNYQLVNSVGGMVGQVGKDKIIQAAVYSTAWDKQQRSFMEAERKKGTLTPENETYYTKKLNNYYNAGLQDENGNPIKFNSSYVPYFDVFKFARETFDAIKPDGLSWDQVYETDADGNPKIDPITKKPIYSPVMIRMEKEGIFPARAKETLNQIFSDPRVSQQLDITGQYRYGGLDGASLRERLVSQQDTTLSSYNDRMHELILKKNLSKDPAAIQEDIDKLQLSIDNIKDSYNELAKVADSNPDYVRGFLYKDDVKGRYSTMFGWSKIKTQTMDNPGWKASFDLQKEANEQLRWEKRLAFDDKWNQLNYEQKERLAKKGRTKGTGDGTDGGGIGGGGVEQANQSAAIDIVHSFESDYNVAASEFSNGSNSFLWETIFSKVPGNTQKLNDLMAKGNTREQSISILLDNAASINKESAEAFKSRWGIQAETEYNKLAPKDVTPDLKDAYDIYKRGKRNFENASFMMKRFNDATEANLNSSFTRESLTGDIKPQKVKLYGKEYNLSKEDIYDLAVYLRGNQSSLGFLNDTGVHNAAKAAAARVKARGNEPLLEAILRQNVTSGGPLGAITMATRVLGHPIKNITDNFYRDSDLDIDLSQVMKVYNKIDNDEYENGMTKKAEIIKNLYGIKPNLKTGVLTGDTETDKATIFDLRRFAGAYTAGQKQNLSHDFSGFANSISGSIEKMNIEAQVIMDVNNNPQIEIVSYDADGERIAGMTIQPDEATSIGLDVNSLYEPREVSLLKNYINNKGNQTSSGNPKEVSTYISGDAYFEKPNFRGMAGSPYDVKANVTLANGRYYSHIYVSDGTKRTVYTGPGSENLTDVYINLVQNVTPAWAQAILSTK